MIAMALSTNPELLIADEPTTALDVTIQAQILELMKTLREQNKMAIMLITHDLGVVAEMADEVVVMYAGKVVERADVDTIYAEPHHPYTQGLLASIPRLGEKRERLEVIKGVGPQPAEPPGGLPVQAALPARDADLRRRAAAPRRLAGARRRRRDATSLPLLADAIGRRARDRRRADA